MYLMMNPTNQFRIVQITDIHLNHYPFDENDQIILTDIKQALEMLKPDLIMLTGDYVNTCQNEQEELIFRNFFAFLNQFHAPKAITYGHHDSERCLDRVDIEKIFNEIVVNKVKREHEEWIEGLSQYAVMIKGDKGLSNVLYVMDSGRTAPGIERTNDWILPRQVEWFRKVSRRYTEMKYNLVFMHSPLPEYDQARVNILAGELREPNQCISFSRINTGLFSEFFFSEQIDSVYCGHNHLNNAEMMWEGIRLIYGMFCGRDEKSGDFRGVRYIDIDGATGAVTTDFRYFYEFKKGDNQ